MADPATAAAASKLAAAAGKFAESAAVNQGIGVATNGEAFKKFVMATVVVFGGVLVLLLLVVVPFTRAPAAPPNAGGYPISSGIPSDYWPMYTSAAEHYKVNPYLLAAMHETESSFSRLSVGSGWNECKAAGPMQFGVVGVPPYNAPAGGCSAGGTWNTHKYAFQPIDRARPDAYPLNRDSLPGCVGVPDDTGCVYDDFDAIAAAAHKLHADGADRNLDSQGTAGAILAYNRSIPYLTKVQSRAQYFERLGAAAVEVPGRLNIRLEDTAPRSLARVIAVANAIEAERIPYCWGGGHSRTPGPSSPAPADYCWEATGEGGVRKMFGSRRIGLDCSGSVRWLLVLSGYRDPGGIPSAQYGGYLKPGRGKRVTFYWNSEHIWVEVDGRSWQTSSSNPEHGPGWTGPSSTLGYIEGHLEGL